jgi:hypothetical protein
MVRFAVFSVAVLMLVMIAVAIIVSVLILATVVALIAIPLYVLARPHFQQRNVRVNPIERLQNLYAEGKIDLFEFERRVAALVRVER